MEYAPTAHNEAAEKVTFFAKEFTKRKSRDKIKNHGKV
jgi:hypothetical protein